MHQLNFPNITIKNEAQELKDKSISSREWINRKNKQNDDFNFENPFKNSLERGNILSDNSATFNNNFNAYQKGYNTKEFS